MAAPHEADLPSAPTFQRLTPASLGQLRVLRLGEVELELDAQRVRVAGQRIHLPPREFQLLEVLMNNAGRVVPRRELLDSFWRPGHSDTNKTLEVHINRLRRRINVAGTTNPIRTVYGIGYIFDLPD